MMTMSSNTPQAHERVTISPVELNGKLAGKSLLPIIFDKNAFAPEVFGWVKFHSGVSSGLAISPDAKTVDSSWIVCNRPDEAINDHAGFIFGLGLNGHLKKLAKYQAFEYLNAKHDVTTVGLLLGLSSAYQGTSDDQVAKIVSIHVPALLPHRSTDLNLSPVVQTAAIASLGLLFMGTAHRRMASVCLNEIGRRDLVLVDSTTVSRESYVLAAGLSFGFITVGAGNGIHDAHQMISSLRKLIVGGSVDEISRIDSRIDTGTSNNRFMDGGDVNVLATAPAAAVGLGLMFLRTNDASIAAMLTISQSQAPSNYLWLLFTTMRSLVMWDEVKPSREWIESISPPGISNSVSGQTGSLVETNRQVYISVVTGSCLALALKNAGSADQKVLDVLMYYFDMFASRNAQATTNTEKMTKSLTRGCISSLILSCSIVAAGSGNLDIMRRIRRLQGNVTLTYGDHVATHMALGLLFLAGGQGTLKTDNMSIAALLCAAFPRFEHSAEEGRLHFAPLRHLWSLAVKPSCIFTRDIVTLETVSTSLEMVMNDGSVVSKITPFLLSSSDRSNLSHILIPNAKYLPLRVPKTFFTDKSVVPLMAQCDHQESQALLVIWLQTTIKQSNAEIDWRKFIDSLDLSASMISHSSLLMNLQKVVVLLKLCSDANDPRMLLAVQNTGRSSLTIDKLLSLKIRKTITKTIQELSSDVVVMNSLRQYCQIMSLPSKDLACLLSLGECPDYTSLLSIKHREGLTKTKSQYLNVEQKTAVMSAVCPQLSIELCQVFASQ